MEQGKTNLASFRNAWYRPGGIVKRMLWTLFSSLFFRHSLAIGSYHKILILKLFGAKIGNGVIIKPSVQIKYPWKLSIGNHTWIGEHVWIDNLDRVSIADHCCISQGALLLCGNHNYGSPEFDLIIHPIVLETGAWVGAKSLVAPGVIMHSHSVLTAGSCATTDLVAYGIYQGNPANLVKTRIIKSR